MDSIIPVSSGNNDLSSDTMIKQIDDDEAIMASLEDTLNDLVSLENEVLSSHLVCKAQAIAFESITGQSIDPYAPVAGFTELPSVTNRDALIDALRNGRVEIANKELTTFIHALSAVIAAHAPSNLSNDNTTNFAPNAFKVDYDCGSQWFDFLKDLTVFLDKLGTDNTASRYYHENTWKTLNDWIALGRKPYIKEFFGDEGQSKEILALVTDDIGLISFQVVGKLEALKNRLIAVGEGKSEFDAAFVSAMEAPVVSQAALKINKEESADTVLYNYLTDVVCNNAISTVADTDAELKAWLNKVVEFVDVAMAKGLKGMNALPFDNSPENIAIKSVYQSILAFDNALGIRVVSKTEDKDSEPFLQTDIKMTSDLNDQQNLIAALKGFFDNTIRVWVNLFEIYTQARNMIRSFITEILRRMLTVFYTNRFSIMVEESAPEHHPAFLDLRNRFHGVNR